VTRVTGSLLFLFAGIAVILALADRTPLHPAPANTPYTLEYLFDFYLDKAVQQDLPGPHAYRILVPFTVYAATRITSIPAMTVDFILKVIFLAAMQFVYFSYLRKFFDFMPSLVGVFLLDIYAAAALSYPVGPSVIETSDILNVVAFALALIAVYEQRLPLLIVTLLIGTLNRETTWLLLPLVALAGWPRRRKGTAITLAVLAVAVPYGLVHWLIHSPSPDWWLTRDIGGNIPFLAEGQTGTALLANARVALMLGPLALPALYRFREHHPFHVLAAVIIPPFIVIHYLVGRIIEMRLWLPLLTILIPLAIDGIQKLTLLPRDRTAAS
jgi:hypothetical protein